MNLESFTGPGSTPSRRRFWDKVTAAVIASQKVPGRNISVDEHQGYGSVVNCIRDRAPSVACPEITVTFADISFCVDVCIPRVFPDGSTKFLTFPDINDILLTPFPISVPEGYSCAYGFLFEDPLATLLFYGEPDCPDVGSEDVTDGGFPVLKAPDGSWTIIFSFAGEVLFAGTSAAAATSPVVISNDYTSCGQEGTLPPPIFDGRATFACGFGGTATIVF